MKDFNFKTGNFWSGFNKLFLSVFAFILVPFILFILLFQFFNENGTYYDNFLRETIHLILLGILISIANFFNGYWPRGHKSRLISGIIASSLTIIYFIAFFLLEPFLNQLGKIGLPLDPLQFLALFSLWQVWRLSYHLCEFEVNEENLWKKEHEKQLNSRKEHRRTPSELKIISKDTCHGSKSALKTVLKIIFISSFLIILKILITHFWVEPNHYYLLTTLDSIIFWFLIFGFLIAILTWSRDLFYKGKGLRLIFGIFNCLFQSLLVWKVFTNTNLQMSLELLGIYLDIEIIKFLIISLITVKALRYPMEYIDYHKDSIINKNSETQSFKSVQFWLVDFLKITSLEKGIESLIRALTFFLILPLLFIIIIESIIKTMDEQWVRELLGILEMEKNVIIIWATILIIPAFLAGIYPPGSLWRLFYILVIIFILAFYLESLLLNGKLEFFIKKQGLSFDLEPVWNLLYVLIILTMLIKIGEFLDNRKGFRTSNGKNKVQLKRKGSILNEFHFQNGKYQLGFKDTRNTALCYLIIPIIILLLLESFTKLLVNNYLFLNELKRIVFIIYWLSLPLMIFAFFRGFYPKGTIPRLFFGGVMCIMLSIWIIIIMNGGHIISSLEIEGASIGIYIDATYLIIVIIMFQLIWLSYYIAEFFSYRSEWKQNELLKH